ncbi:MAG: hypothetical protein K2P09_08015 [Erysipelotrichales bacterium]|nr:hypothetical protein [Erysipelotrichales bacterium]
MFFEIGQYRLDIDVARTKHFYENADFVSKSCSCDGCLNFEKAVSALPISVIAFFTNLGTDMKKVCECYVNDTADDGTLLYGGFYHICGTLLDGKSAWKSIDENTFCWDSNATFSICPDFFVSFQENVALLEKDFPLPVIQLEFFAKIPWVLEKENTYQ